MYWLVWVSFLCTMVESRSLLLVTSTSGKANLPFFSLSIVNCMLGDSWFKCVWNDCSYFSPCGQITKVSSICLSQRLGRKVADYMSFTSRSSIRGWRWWGKWWIIIGCTTFCMKNRTSRQDYRMSHISPFIVDLAPTSSSMAVHHNVFTAASNKWQEQCQIWWVQQIVYATVFWLSLCIETRSAHLHYLELSWAMLPSAFTKHSESVPSWWWVCLSVCACVWGRREMGRDASILAVYGMCRTLYIDWRKHASILSWSGSHNFWYFTHNICFSLRSLVSFPYAFAQFSLDYSGKGLGTRVDILASRLFHDP